MLADEAVPTAELSRAEGERRLSEAEAEYDGRTRWTSPRWTAAMDRMQSARAMVEAASA